MKFSLDGQTWHELKHDTKPDATSKCAAKFSDATPKPQTSDTVTSRTIERLPVHQRTLAETALKAATTGVRLDADPRRRAMVESAKAAASAGRLTKLPNESESSYRFRQRAASMALAEAASELPEDATIPTKISERRCSCGFEYGESAKFCENCGAKLTDATDDAAVPPALAKASEISQTTEQRGLAESRNEDGSDANPLGRRYERERIRQRLSEKLVG